MQRHHQALAAPRTAHPQPRTSCLGTRRQGALSLPRHRLPRRLRAVKMLGRLLSFGNRKVHTWLHPGRPTRWALPHPSPGPHVPVASGQVPGCPRLKTAFRRARFPSFLPCGCQLCSPRNLPISAGSFQGNSPPGLGLCLQRRCCRMVRNHHGRCYSQVAHRLPGTPARVLGLHAFRSGHSTSAASPKGLEVIFRCFILFF